MKRIMRLLVVCAAAAGLLLSLSSSAGAQKMYWAEFSAGKIQRANLDGSNVEELVTGLAGPLGIDLDVAGGKMYWAEPGIIKRADLDGSNVEDLVTLGGSPFAIGIALDVADGKMYWTNAGNHPATLIQRADLNGSNIEDLLGGFQTPHGIDLDLTSGKMYWTDNGAPGTVQRANLDGSNLQTLVAQNFVSTTGIALDVAGGEMYWLFQGKVQRANLDGSSKVDLVTGLTNAFGIALDVAGGKMYWTDFNTGKIQRANLDGSNVEDPVTGLAGPAGIALDLTIVATSLQLLGQVPMPGQQLGDIAVNPNTDRVYVGAGFSSGQILTIVNATNPASPAIVNAFGNTSGATVNPNTNRFYTANLFGGRVFVYNGATNTVIKSLVIGACPGSFDIDVTTNRIYVTRQCGGGGPPLGVDPFFVIDGTTDTLLTPTGLGTGGVLGAVRVNSATGRAYPCASGTARIFGPAPSFTLLGSISGQCVNAVNPVTNRLYLPTGSNLVVRDGTNEAVVIATISGISGATGVNTNLNRIYVLDNPGEAVNVIDGATNAILETFALPAGMQPSLITVDSTKNRLYVGAFDTNIGQPVLLIIEDEPAGPTPSEQIDDALDFIEDSVNDESLEGDGPGKSADNRLNALINMIEEAGALIDDGQIAEACDQLEAALKKTDGQPKPPDFVTGDAALELAEMIQDIRSSLECE